MRGIHATSIEDNKYFFVSLWELKDDLFVPGSPRIGDLVGHVERRAVQEGDVRVDLGLDAVHPQTLSAFLPCSSWLTENSRRPLVYMRNEINSLSFIDLDNKIRRITTMNLTCDCFSESKSLHVLEAKQVGELCQAVLRHCLQVGAEGPHDGLHRPLPNLKFKFSASLLICADRNFKGSTAIIDNKEVSHFKT